MKTIAPLLLALLSFAPMASGQDAPAGSAPQDAMARVVFSDDGGMTIWITAASTTNLEYKAVKDSINRKRKPRSSVDALYFFEPPAFTEAVELFKNRDYKSALDKFTAVKVAFKRVDEIKGNYSTQAAFYELECARRDGDLEKLHALLEEYRSGSLAREDFRLQEEIYALWDAVRTKEWTRANTLATEMLEQKKWTGTQVTQIFYCQGLALEGLEKAYAALNAFNGAMTADYTASHELTPKAALACFRIIDGLEEVDLARKLFGTEDENPNSTGHRLLQEAAALCDLWDSALGAGQPLPEKYKTFLKYKAK